MSLRRGIRNFTREKMEARTKRIVITGGPGTGKTVLVEAQESRGYFCFHEIIREMTQEAKNLETTNPMVNPLAFVSDPLAFNKRILEGRLKQFRRAEQVQQPFVFYDRGIPDIIAYMDYFDQVYDGDFTGPCQQLRYDLAVVLPPWKEIYRHDEERLESYGQAVQIHECLLRSYRDCGYEVFTLEPGTVEARVERLLERIHGWDG